VNAHQEHGCIRQVLPAVELHAEPVVDEEIPEVLLPLHGRLVRAAQLPITRAFVQPSDQSLIALTTQGVHPGAGHVRLLTRLLSNIGRPPICSRHGRRIPTTTRYLLLTGDYLAGFVVTLHLICATPHRRPPRRLRRHAPPDLRDSSPATTSPASSSRLVIGVRVRRVAAWV